MGSAPIRLFLLFAGIAFAVALVTLAGCAAPPAPDELRLVHRQQQELLKSGAAEFAAEGLNQYVERLTQAEQSVHSEQKRFAALRDYSASAAQLRDALEMGDRLKAEVAHARQLRAQGLRRRAADIEREIARHNELSATVSGLGGMRKNLAQARALLDESSLWIERQQFGQAEALLLQAEVLLVKARSAVKSTMARYLDSAQVARWRTLKQEAIQESKAPGRKVILIDKLARTLELYREGRAVRSYRVGLGRKGFADKLHAGDRATPEGHYHVVKKNPDSKYFKALLINYPNAEDVARYRAASSRGSVPGAAGIGGLVEIHGGGNASLTDGCISMDNADMSELYDLVGVNTPVTIIGTADANNMLHELIAQRRR